MKIRVKIATLEWDDFVLHKKFKSLMNVDHSLLGDPNKYRLIDELNFKNCVCLKINTTSKFFVGITYKKIKFIIYPGFFMPIISSHIHLFRISNINQTWFITFQDK